MNPTLEALEAFYVRPADVHVVACPHCGWSFAGTLAKDDARTIRALRDHLAAKHHEHPSDAELRLLVQTPRDAAQR